MPGYIYVIGCDLTERVNKRKIGLTIHPVHRMRQYDTGDCPGEGLEKRYQALFLTKTNTKKELHALEHLIHEYFKEKRLLRENNGNSEWFQVSLESVIQYVKGLPMIENQLTSEEVSDIQEKAKKPASKDEITQLLEEIQLMEEQQENLASVNELPFLERFIKEFLEGKHLRSNQEELFTNWKSIVNSDLKDRYNGLIQWPTGTGKTVALLLLIAFAAEKAKQNGKLYRALLIAPKNDIFDTIVKHIRKLSKFGLTICEGHNGNLSSLSIPNDIPVLITATHAALTNKELMINLPPMDHVHYDEVHRIGGEIFFDLLKERLDAWNTRFLTGTSATPRTSNPVQHKKIAELFGNPYTILHKCDIDEAITKGWIAPPRFNVTVASKNIHRKQILNGFLQMIKDKIILKQNLNWKGGKVIVYLPIREEVRQAVNLAKECLPTEWKIYTAVEDAEAARDDTFIEDNADGLPRLLFACERYREGSDIQGLEMTCVLMGDTIASNILLQIIGRALRADYTTKEGWCCIFRPSEEGVSEDDVLDQILFEILETIGRNDSIKERKQIREIVQTFLGAVTVSGKTYCLEETVDRIQALYERRTFERGVPKEKYDSVRATNKEMGLKSRNEYYESKDRRRLFLDKPDEYFRDCWSSWYHFLGVDISCFPQTKVEFHRVCKERGIPSWEEYRRKGQEDLPENPGELYSDWTNPTLEFAVDEEIVW
jgi:superfamily II DNA or RNA helicase